MSQLRLILVVSCGASVPRRIYPDRACNIRIHHRYASYDYIACRFVTACCIVKLRHNQIDNSVFSMVSFSMINHSGDWLWVVIGS